jgi:hypothetical protein
MYQELYSQSKLKRKTKKKKMMLKTNVKKNKIVEYIDEEENGKNNREI